MKPDAWNTPPDNWARVIRGELCLCCLAQLTPTLAKGVRQCDRCEAAEERRRERGE